MIELGTNAPPFSLPNAVDGTTVSLEDVSGGPALCMMFICNHCPYVVHVVNELSRLAAEYLPKGVAFCAVNANNLDTHPQDGPEFMQSFAAEHGWEFPYLFDESQKVALAYQAACTPDFFVFDRNSALVYRGQLDESRPGNDVPVTGRDLRAALDCVLNGQPVNADQRPSCGCNIKWKPENRPSY